MRNKNIRRDILPSRDANALKKFVQNHIIPGSNITHDGWAECIYSSTMMIQVGHINPTTVVMYF